ncbi:MAG: vWA domain-containing protein [Patescibacteria group bacterium]|nr:VWA domain-containing protein [bacterium]MDZ4240927.1 vWA domain-containing protein [Patescibacteria group bacterium]
MDSNSLSSTPAPKPSVPSNEWARQKKTAYVIIICAVLFLLAFVPVAFLYFETPTCFDGKKNGTEMGTDCGGKCAILCAAEVLEPIILWERTFKVTEGVYSAVAYVENPNISALVSRVHYVFKLYDANNELIAERPGVTFIPAKKTFGIFEGAVSVGEAVPTRVTFEFSSRLVWEKEITPEPPLSVSNIVLSKTDTKPRIDAQLSNDSIRPVSNVEAVAIIFDSDGIAIGASRTFIDYLEKAQTANITFTWPEPFDTGLGFCNVPVDTMLVIDRSGSMDDDGLSPPEPLTSVKSAAESFVERLQDRDQVGLVSFATSASRPADSFLTHDFEALKGIIGSVFIRSDSVQNTNIKDGMEEAYKELTSAHTQADSSKIIVVLTDGIATHPQNPRNAADETYPETEALKTAQKAKDKGIQIFAIGLGNNVNQAFLQKLASQSDQYFFAPDRNAVEGIYKRIATALCRKGPTVITIIPRVFGDE